MAVAERRTSEDPHLKLRRLCHRAGDRKLRLFACACVREVGLFLKEDASRQAVRLAERFADGLGMAQDLAAAYLRAESARAAVYAATRADWKCAWRMRKAACAARSLLLPAAADAAFWVCQDLLEFGDKVDAAGWNDAARLAHARFLDDLLCRPTPRRPVDPSWLRRNDRCAAKVAQAIYDERRFEDLPVLADALEEAGCDDDALLAHCREPEVHVRGCWAVDLIGGRA
jgi:hypothetical protein